MVTNWVGTSTVCVASDQSNPLVLLPHQNTVYQTYDFPLYALNLFITKSRGEYLGVSGRK